MKSDDECDVLVIGSGASGAIASLVLGQAGLKVVCLEQGEWTEPSAHPHYDADWEWQRHGRWSPNNKRKAAADYPVESATSSILMWNAVGGSTNIYTAIWPRFRPSDFRKGTEHGLAPDWPIAYEDLAPYYDARSPGRHQRPGRRSGPAAATRLSDAALALASRRPDAGRCLRPPRLALVAIARRHHLRRL